MPAAILKHLVVASALMSAALTASALTTSSTTFSDQELQAMLAQSRPVQADQTAEPTSGPRLRVGLSDSSAELVLPWFLAELVNAVNQRTSPQDLAKNLRDGI
ncbi:hypothetical protein [Ralstonia flaminis]|jgi:hypothetical protein|uniref:Uncharacterized protein n=1 Tax=Ralstonia flaminis TaxID=3058597 RepID=A0ABN9JPC5_9RALS|nr:hypothetical protein [Ralstonia sp. LMG 18101]CAJ0819833.1 hypothetical protein LMG18101_04081 [Ralstonia sp. LMG 18101]